MARVLFVNGQSDRHWIDSLFQIALKVGKTVSLMNHRELKTESFLDYELFILDSGAISDLVSVVKYIRSRNDQARIVVVSSAPTWKQARELLLVGATDYVRKVDDEIVIQGLLQGTAPRTYQAKMNKHSSRRKT